MQLEPLEDRTLLSVFPSLASDTVASTLKLNAVSHAGLYSPPIVVQESSNTETVVAPVSSYPASYDLRNVGGTNYVTSVKNQNPYGTCWAFATYGSLESSILMAGGATNDFSERNLVYRHGFDWGVNDGGTLTSARHI